MKRPKMCLHRISEHDKCGWCERMIATGKTAERLLYTQQRVWQLEQKALGRCEICGKVKGKCPSKSRCWICLSRDVKRHRKARGTVRKWVPGGRGRPRTIRAGLNHVSPEWTEHLNQIRPSSTKPKGEQQDGN